MNKISVQGICLILMLCIAGLRIPDAGAQTQTLGIGANYWRTVDELDADDFDRDGLSWVVTYQRHLSRLLAIQADLEWFPSGFGGTDKDVFAPQAFVLAGGSLYLGAGIGILYSDGEFNDKPYYAVRLGLDLELLPTIYFDVHANYQFSEWDDINRLQEKIGSDTVFLGAAVRFEF